MWISTSEDIKYHLRPPLEHNTRRNTSTSTNTVTILPRCWRLHVKPALENVTKPGDKQGSAWKLQVHRDKSSLLKSKILLSTLSPPCQKNVSILLELKDMALNIVYIIPLSTCAGGRMRHSRWLAVKTFRVNEDDYYPEPSSRSVYPWTWIMLTMWKCSGMDWSEQLCKCEEISLTGGVE